MALEARLRGLGLEVLPRGAEACAWACEILLLGQGSGPSDLWAYPGALMAQPRNLKA